MKRMSRAIWYVRQGVAELRTAPVDAPKDGQALVRTLFSGISRGTERLVISGAVPEPEWGRMRAPLQVGDFPFPVKYGYCAVGIVEAGPAALRGKTVFCLHPHQDAFVAPVPMLAPVPDGIPARRATLAANMETALNALWDSGAGPADRIVVVGAGVVGLLIAWLAGRLPGAEVCVVDIAGQRRALVESLGAAFETKGRAFGADVVFHTSASAAGLDTAIAAAGMEGSVVELSWYGEKEVPVRLGGAFHSQRLKLVSSQVGHVSPGRRPRWDYRRRMEAALRLLADDRLDQLVAEEIDFEAAATELPRLLGPGVSGLAPVIRYPGA
ncbi:MAG: zinc-binding alcohol dehydrogenase [Hyphomicrobiaceae bacterium]|nr:zinc-binding alcohol dehydrogenase [Hyphomicrobiaceae bacterium]